MEVSWRKSFSLVLVAAALAAGASRPAGAISLGFEPASTEVPQGAAFDVEVWLRDLGGALVGSYGITVGFDDGVLALEGVTFDTGLGGPLESIQEAILTPGAADVAETSLLFALADAGQPMDELLLFSLSFRGVAPGTSPLAFSRVVLGDELGDPLDAELRGGRVTVTQTVIPEPGTLLLLGSGLIGLARRGRRIPADRG